MAQTQFGQTGADYHRARDGSEGAKTIWQKNKVVAFHRPLTYEEIAEFWDTHSTVDYDEETYTAEAVTTNLKCFSERLYKPRSPIANSYDNDKKYQFE